MSFKKAKFILADLRGAIFSRSNFEEADLTVARLEGATLLGAEFVGARLKNTSFCNADLTGVTFERADLLGAFFQGANFQGEHVYPYRINLMNGLSTQTVKSGVNFYGANLTGANFKDCSLNDVDFTKANLANIHWSKDTTDWTGAKGLAEARNVPEELQKLLGL